VVSVGKWRTLSVRHPPWCALVAGLHRPQSRTRRCPPIRNPPATLLSFPAATVGAPPRHVFQSMRLGRVRDRMPLPGVPSFSR